MNKYAFIMFVAGIVSYSACAFAVDVRDKMNLKGPTTISGTTTLAGSTTVSGTVQGSSPIILEGATVDGIKTTVAVTDPTAARTITIPNGTGTLGIECVASHDYDDSVVAWTMTKAESQCSHIVFTNASGAVNAILDAAYPGKIRTVVNSSGQAVTLKVTGQTGSSVASAKNAVFCDNATDTVEISEQP